MVDNPKINTTLSFEDAFNRLTETAAKLERGGLPLEESLALFEEGVLLTHHCEELLAKAELRVSQLTPTTANVTVASRSYVFSSSEDEEDADDETDDSDDDNWTDDDLRNALNELKF